MNNPRLRHLPSNKNSRFTDTREETAKPQSATDLASKDGRYIATLREQYGADFITDWPAVNPEKIIEELTFSPMAAAHWCHQACGLLAHGHHRRVNQYLITAYTIALGFRDNRRQIENLATVVADGRSRYNLNADAVQSKLLHYLFIYIFHQSGLTTRDRATQYAQGLQPFFEAGTPPPDVELSLRQHGPDRLRRAAMRRAGLLRAAQERAAIPCGSALAPMDEVLAKIAEEDEARKRKKIEDGISDFGPRGLPPDEEEPGEPDDAGHLFPANDQAGGTTQITSTDDTRESQDGLSAEENNSDEEPTEISRSERHTINADLNKILLRMMDLGASMSERSFDIKEQKRLQMDIVNLGIELNKVRRSLIQAV